MPHIVIEYTEDTLGDDQLPRLMDGVFEAVAGTGLFDVQNIKLRLIPIRHYRLAEGQKGFMHVQCRIHAGRTESQKKSLGQAIVPVIELMRTGLSVITCEVVEMHRSSYVKSKV